MYKIEFVESRLVHCIWYAVEEEDSRVYSDPANEFWSIGFACHSDSTYSVDLFGPTLRPRKLHTNKGEQYWGIEFNAQVFLNGLEKRSILDSHSCLQTVAKRFVLCGRTYEIPSYSELPNFASGLEADGILSNDNQIFLALEDKSSVLSKRTSQRRFRKVTGMTKKAIEQLKRARYAYSLLQQGHCQADAAILAGYADQSHMIRSFKLIRGLTPAQILSGLSELSS